MRRSLSLAFAVRLLVLVLVLAGLRAALPSLGWAVPVAAVLVLGVGTAAMLGWTVRRSVAPLERAAARMTEMPTGVPEVGFREFDGLARAISEASGEVARALGAAADSRRALEAMVDSMQDPVLAVDEAGRILWTNKRMQHLMPGSAESGAVRVGHALVQTIRDPEVLACVRSSMVERTVTQRRSTTLLPGRIFEVNAAPMPAGGAVAVLHDVTRMEQVERQQREFVANVSHELRTPLTSISGYVETLLDHEAGLTPQARVFLETILKNAGRMTRLTEDLLLMARVENSDQELRQVRVPARDLVEDAVRAVRGMLEEEERAELEVGEVTTGAVIADPDAVVQVLSNLMENGIKYGRRRGGERARVVVEARAIEDGGPKVEFRVSDEGAGIASEHLQRIFERFYRVDKARSRESGGTGLGLAIARHLVERSGGTIRAESELNRGSRFLFTLPAAAAASTVEDGQDSEALRGDVISS